MILKRQKEYAHVDYKGLTDEGKELLKERREKMAGQFKAKRKEIDERMEKKLEDIAAVYEKDSKQYKKAVEKAKKEWEEELKKSGEELKSQKYGAKNHLFENRKQPEPNNKPLVESFKVNKKKVVEEKTKEKLTARLKRMMKKGGEFAKDNKKGLIIGSSVLAASGAGYGIYKGVKKEKKERELKKKVRGYEK